MSEIEVVLRIQDLTGSPDQWTPEQVVEQERVSLEVWNDLGELGRTALAVIMRDTLIRLLEDPLNWLPTSIDVESGTRLMVMFELELGAIDERVIAMRLAAEERMHGELLDILKMSRDLEGS